MSFEDYLRYCLKSQQFLCLHIITYAYFVGTALNTYHILGTFCLHSQNNINEIGLQQMKRILLYQKIQNIKAASQFEHKLIDSIWKMMQMKRKAQFDYKLSLEAVNRELEKYIMQENGFLTEIVKAFQSYITVVYQNQNALIEGYDNQILSFLLLAKQSKMEQDLINRVKFFDSKITECQQKILSYKKTIKDNETQLQVIGSEVKLGSRIGSLKEEDMKRFGEKYNDIKNLKQANEEKLQCQVDGMMELTMTHNQILHDLEEYETVYLQRKGSEVFDNFMRAFVLEVSFIRSMQFDVGNILQKVKERQQQHKKVALNALRVSMQKQGSKVATFIRDAYKKVSNSFMLQIKEQYISQRIKNKWSRICQYYNEAH